MCYGAYCRGYGSTLTWDVNSGFASTEVESFREQNAGCYVTVMGNDETGVLSLQERCQQEQGLACSVYPYTTTDNGDVDVMKGGPVSRCVDMGEYYRECSSHSTHLSSLETQRL